MSMSLAPAMFTVVGLSGCTMKMEPISINDLKGEIFYDSLNNTGVRGYLEKNNLEFIRNEDDKPLHFQLDVEDELYLVTDMPGSLKKLSDFKGELDLPGPIKPIILKIVVGKRS